MILDTSAIMAMLQQEPGAPAMEEALAAASAVAITAAGLVEEYMVCEGRAGENGARQLDALLDRLRPEIVPFTAEHAALAHEAGAAMARADTRLVSTWAIASLMPWPKHATNPCCSRAMTSPTPM